MTFSVLFTYLQIILLSLVLADPDLTENISKAAADYLNAINSDILKEFFNPEIYEENKAIIISTITRFLNPLEHVFEKIQYRLFTRNNFDYGYNLKPTPESIRQSTFSNARETKFLIHGYLINLPENSAFFNLKDTLLKEGDYNVIVVDWTKYNKDLYPVTSAYVPIVGWKTAMLIQSLMIYTGIDAGTTHMIGHSLGAQVAAFTGKTVSGLGRISGLDAAGPIFESLPKNFRLFYTDAQFVDAIHTNGAITIIQGFGTIYPYGHLDFYPNGGSQQPGCFIGNFFEDTEGNINIINSTINILSCSHNRAVYLYITSINKCNFLSVHCSSYLGLLIERCTSSNFEVDKMGFHSYPIPSLPPKSKFFLKTTAKYPYCEPNEKYY